MLEVKLAKEEDFESAAQSVLDNWEDEENMFTLVDLCSVVTKLLDDDVINWFVEIKDFDSIPEAFVFLKAGDFNIMLSDDFGEDMMDYSGMLDVLDDLQDLVGSRRDEFVKQIGG